MIRVDNQTYTWMGASNQSDVYVNQTAFEYTSTRSIFTMSVGGYVQMKITFLSPVTPDELLRSSLPYSYMDVETSSLDGNSHTVQLYTDISAEWVSGDHTATAQWSYGVVRGQSQPKSFAPVPSPTTPLSVVLPTTYGTETFFSLETSVAHPWRPVHAPGQGHRPTSFSWPHPPHQTGKQFSERSVNQTNPPPGGVAYHKVWRQQQLEFSEIDQQANWYVY